MMVETVDLGQPSLIHRSGVLSRTRRWSFKRSRRIEASTEDLCLNLDPGNRVWYIIHVGYIYLLTCELHRKLCIYAVIYRMLWCSVFVSCHTLLNEYHPIHAYSLNCVYAVTYWMYEMTLSYIWLMNSCAENCIYICHSLETLMMWIYFLLSHWMIFHFAWKQVQMLDTE